jgi:hypothetical protein
MVSSKGFISRWVVSIGQSQIEEVLNGFVSPGYFEGETDEILLNNVQTRIREAL